MGKLRFKDVSALPVGNHCDGGGLYLRVLNGGKTRTWCLRRLLNGKDTWRSLGDTNELSLSEARKIAASMRSRDTHTVQREVTFGEFLDEACAAAIRVHKWKSENTERKWSRMLAMYALPYLEDKKLNLISRDDILNVLLPIWDEKACTSRQLQAALAWTFDYARTKGLCHENPASWRGNLNMELNARRKIKHYTAHEWMDVPDIVRILWEDKFDRAESAKALIFQILTASRSSEVLDMTWDEIDGNVWTLKLGRTKTIDDADYIEKPHRVPLSRQALALLARLPHDDEKVFHASTSALERLARRHGSTPHGYRSSFRSWCADQKKDFASAEISLSHKIGGRTTRAYFRTDLLEARRPLMQEWADYCFSKITEKL